MRSTRSARTTKLQQSRPTASRRARWAGSTGTTPQPTSSQIKITSGLASSSAASSSSGQSGKDGPCPGLLRGAGHLGGAVPGLLQHVVQLALARAADNQNHNSTSSLCPTAAQSTIPSSHSWRKNPARSPVTPPNCRRAVTT